MSIFSDFVFSPHFLPLLYEPTTCCSRDPHRVGVGNMSFDDDTISFITPLSPPPPHSAFEVLISNGVPGPGDPTHFSEPWNMSLFSHDPKDVAEDITRICSETLKGEGIDDTLPFQVNSGSDDGGSEKESEIAVEGGEELPPHHPPMAMWSPSSDITRRKSLLCHASTVSDKAQPQCTGVPDHRRPTFGLSPSLLSSALEASVWMQRPRSARKLATEVAHITLGGHRMSQEDALCIHEQVPFPPECVIGNLSPTYSVYGVFDGHNGSHLSNLASLYFLEHFNDALRRTLPTLHESEKGVKKRVDNAEHTLLEAVAPQRFLSNALVQALIHLDRTLYDATQGTQSSYCTGTTASIVAFYHSLPTSPDKGPMCYLSIANLGDSRTVLARISDGCVLFRTVDHRFSAYPSERARVERCGGCIECDRIDGALEVTRSLGDFPYKLPPELWQLQNDKISESFSCRNWRSSSSDDGLFSPEGYSSSTHQFFSSHHCSGKRSTLQPSRLVSQKETVICRESSCATPPHQTCRCSHRPSLGEKELTEATRTHLTSNVVSNVADVYEAEVTGNEFLLLASDGLWDIMDTLEAVEFVRARLLQAGYSSEVGSYSSSPLPNHSGVHNRDNALKRLSLEFDHRRVGCSIVSQAAIGVGVASEMTQVDSSLSDCDAIHVGFVTPKYGSDGGKVEKRGNCCTPQCGVLHDVANSLANYVVHQLHGTDNVTIIILVFRTVD